MLGSGSETTRPQDRDDNGEASCERSQLTL